MKRIGLSCLLLVILLLLFLYMHKEGAVEKETVVVTEEKQGIEINKDNFPSECFRNI